MDFVSRQGWVFFPAQKIPIYLNNFMEIFFSKIQRLLNDGFYLFAAIFTMMMITPIL